MNHQKIRQEIKEFFKTVSIEKLTKDFEKLGYKIVDIKKAKNKELSILKKDIQIFTKNIVSYEITLNY
jgi:hypothetical protein